MKPVEWKGKYLLGNPFVDKEHQIFAGLINKLIEAVGHEKETVCLDRIILEIQKYAEFHFVSEENYMIEMNYPGLLEHQEQHSTLLEEFSLALNYLELGDKSYNDFISFLIVWFTKHTVTQDKKICAFFSKSQGKK